MSFGYGVKAYEAAMGQRVLSPQRRRVLKYIVASVSRTGHFPSNAEIANHMGWENPGSVNDVKNTLRGAGLLSREVRTGEWSVTKDGAAAVAAETQETE